MPSTLTGGGPSTPTQHFRNDRIAASAKLSCFSPQRKNISSRFLQIQTLCESAPACLRHKSSSHEKASCRIYRPNPNLEATKLQLFCNNKQLSVLPWGKNIFQQNIHNKIFVLPIPHYLVKLFMIMYVIM